MTQPGKEWTFSLPIVASSFCNIISQLNCRVQHSLGVRWSSMVRVDVMVKLMLA